MLVFFLHVGPLSFYNVIEEERHGLASTFLLKCSFCGKPNRITTSGQHRSGLRGPPAFNINTRAALGCLHAGIGQTHINNVLSTLNVPTLNSVTFKLREREVGKAVEKIAKGSCQNYLQMERGQALEKESEQMKTVWFLFHVPLISGGKGVERGITHVQDKQQS